MKDNIIINLLTEDQAKELIRKELEIFFKHRIFESRESKQKINTIVDLGGLLAARPFIGSRSTIYKKAAEGKIPHAKRGKKLLFDLNEIDIWLLANKRSTADEIEDLANGRLSEIRNRRKS